jgi:uncharacterized damage-inducible protein DinB
MSTLQAHRRLFAWNDWAHREVLAALGRAEPPQRAAKVFSHMLGAEFLWLARLLKEDRRVVVWPEGSREIWRVELEELRWMWSSYLGSLTDAELGSMVAYVNSKGEAYSSSVDDILTHVVQHASYHRGQIAGALRDAGQEPPYTDYIHAARRGLIGGAGDPGI